MKTLPQEDRRKFNRFSLDLLMKIKGIDHTGEPHEEKTSLKNISGGGAKFTTQYADRYVPGQEVEITIYLPGINEVQARMKGQATVLRVERLDEINAGASTADIALMFKSRLQFIRK